MIVELEDEDTKLLQLAESAASGEDVVLVYGGKALARVTHLPKPEREIGTLDGMYTIPKDFDTMFDREIEALFHGKSVD